MCSFPTVWEPYSPDSLLDTCIKFCLNNLNTISRLRYDEVDCQYILFNGINLPAEICERMMHLYREDLDSVITDKFLTLFSDTSTTRLQRVNISDSKVTGNGFKMVTKHPVCELDISNCSELSESALLAINALQSDLLSLIVGSTVQIFPSALQEHHEDSQEIENPVMLRAPHLRRLVIRGLEFRSPIHSEYWPQLLQPLCHLTHLDLSSCYYLGDLTYLHHLRQLVSLILFDVPRLQDVIHNLCQLKTLRHLDVSQSELCHYKNPNRVLKDLVDSLSHLVSLDISGTNLAGKFQGEDVDDTDSSSTTPEPRRSTESSFGEAMLTDIPGLKSRVGRPLDFLGLLNTAHEACFRHHIPAVRIAGDANEQQILTAAQSYCERPDILHKVLNDLFHVFRYESCLNPRLALDVILVAMKRHLWEKPIQIAGSASLFYIVKSEEKYNFTIKIRCKIIKVLLDAMNMHRHDTTMLRNGCLTLIHFKIPQDVLFDYQRLVDILLFVVSQEDQDEFVQRIAIYLLNSLACQVDNNQKQLVGHRGAIKIMLQLIESRLSRKVCDEVMETAWSTMWNVTDETPSNCQKFLDEKGMELFLGCLQTFTDKPELLRNMMGLLGNVAEVKHLRGRLMKDEYLKVFCDLLDSRSDGIEVSYNAAGILSHIASDGPDDWSAHQISTVQREEVLARMVAAIDRWHLNSNRNINYRSFEPILRLLHVEHTPETQLWAVWALANLTRVYPEKYCSLLKEEGGIEILRQVMKKPNQYPKVMELSFRIIDQCDRYLTHGNLDGSANTDDS